MGFCWLQIPIGWTGDVVWAVAQRPRGRLDPKISVSLAFYKAASLASVQLNRLPGNLTCLSPFYAVGRMLLGIDVGMLDGVKKARDELLTSHSSGSSNGIPARPLKWSQFRPSVSFSEVFTSGGKQGTPRL